MKKIRFCELQAAPEISPEAECFKKIAQEQGVEFEYEILEESKVLESSAPRVLLNQFDYVRASFEFSNLILEHYEELTTDVRGVSGFDLIVKDQDHFWPRLNCTKVMREMVVQKSPHHNLTESAYVVSDSSVSRALISILIQMGHKRVTWATDQKKSHAMQDLQYLQQTFLGADIRFLEKENLTAQNDRASILVNTLDLSADTEALKDLIYFNFMSPHSLVVDLNLNVNLQSEFIQEAHSADLKTISSLEYRSFYDLSLLQMMKPSLTYTYESYLEALKTALSAT